MKTKHLQKLFLIAEALKCTPCLQGHRTMQQWKSITLLCLMSTLIIYNIIHWMMLLFKKTLSFLLIIISVSFIIINIMCAIGNKRDIWIQFVHNFSQVDEILDGTSENTNRTKEYGKIISIYISVHVYFIICSLQFYTKNADDLNFFFHILMFLQNYYQLFTCLIIITVNVSIEFQYYRIVRYLHEGPLRSSVGFCGLNQLEDLCVMMKQTVDHVSDIFGWQLMVVHGQAIINLLGLLSEITLTHQSLFAVIQMQQSVFTVSSSEKIVNKVQHHIINYTEKVTVQDYLLVYLLFQTLMIAGLVALLR